MKTDKKLEIDQNNKHQVMEISKIGWFSYEETLAKFREYDGEKKNVLINVYKKLKNLENKSISTDENKEHFETDIDRTEISKQQGTHNEKNSKKRR